MARRTCISATLALFFLSCGHNASAQTQPTPLLTSARAVLPPTPHLQLSWPVASLRFSFSTTDELTGYASGPLQLYRAESLWLSWPNLQFLTAGSRERAFELDCRLTCQPVVKQAFDLEARLPLPVTTRAAPTSYAFLRASAIKSSQSPRFSQPFSGGFAGALNF